MIPNLLTSLTDPDNVADGYSRGFDLNNGGWIIIILLIIICITLLIVAMVFKTKMNEYKKEVEKLKEEKNQTATTENKNEVQEIQISETTVPKNNK
ncbi:MAG: hypothetical protein ACI4MN_02105 [Candidatus Coproplasma sp.]